MASVNCIGVVVNVNIEEPITSNTSLIHILIAISIPSVVTVNIPHSNNIFSPLVIKTFINAVKAIIINIPLIPFNINFKGTFDVLITVAIHSTTNK